MDGNFSAEHMRCRTRDTEVPLFPGMAFMANPDSYQAHLSTGKEIAQVSGICSSHMTVDTYLSDSPVHAIHTRLLNRHTPEDHISMSLASAPPLVAMDSSSLHL